MKQSLLAFALLLGSLAHSLHAGTETLMVDPSTHRVTAAAADFWDVNADQTGSKESNTVFVDPAGSDSTGARGLRHKPVATLARAIALASAGDTIAVRPGSNIATGSLTINKSVRMDCRGASFSTPTADSDSRRLYITANDVTIIGGDFSGGRASGTTSGSSSAFVDVICVTGSRVTLDGVHVHDSIGSGIYVVGPAQDCTIKGNFLIEGCYRGIFAEDTGSYNTFPSRLRIMDGTIRNCMVPGVGSSGTADAVHLSGGIKIKATSSAADTTATVSRVRVESAGEEGIETQGNLLDGMIENCRIVDCLTGISTDTVQRFLVSNNHIILSNGAYAGIEVGTNQFGTYEGNFISCPSGSAQKGYAVTTNLGIPGYSNTIKGGQVRGCGICVDFGGSAETHIEGVTFEGGAGGTMFYVNNANAAIIRNCVLYTNGCYDVAEMYSTSGALAGLDFSNNRIYNGTGGPVQQVIGLFASGSGSIVNPVIERNTYPDSPTVANVGYVASAGTVSGLRQTSNYPSDKFGDGVQLLTPNAAGLQRGAAFSNPHNAIGDGVEMALLGPSGTQIAGFGSAQEQFPYSQGAAIIRYNGYGTGMVEGARINPNGLKLTIGAHTLLLSTDGTHVFGTIDGGSAKQLDN